MELAQYSQGTCCRGFKGPYPSTSLDKKSIMYFYNEISISQNSKHVNLFFHFYHFSDILNYYLNV